MENTSNQTPEIETLLKKAREEGYREGFNEAAKAQIYNNYGVWAPAPRPPEETEVETGSDTISCLRPGVWDY